MFLAMFATNLAFAAERDSRRRQARKAARKAARRSTR
jgi:hypothetical protein